MSRFETSSLFQLTAMRIRLFLREPEAIFWTFCFPILLAVGLGIAFRNRPADVLPLGAGFFFVTASSVAVITAPSPPGPQPGASGRKHR